MCVFKLSWTLIFIFLHFCFCNNVNKVVIVLSAQVAHLEVVNKQYVKVIPAHGVNTAEVVSCMKMLLCPLAFHIM